MDGLGSELELIACCVVPAAVLCLHVANELDFLLLN